MAENQLSVYQKDNSHDTEFSVTYWFTGMAKTFGDYLREQLNARDLKVAEVSRRSGVSKQQLGRIINNERYPTTGALSRPSVATVDKIAKAIGWDADEARHAAGYASTNGHSSILEGFDALSREDQELASRQIKAIIEIFLSKGAVVEVPSHAAPVINEQRKVA